MKKAWGSLVLFLTVAVAIAWMAELAPASAETAEPLLGKWRGQYTCLQGDTGLLLTIDAAEGLVFAGEFAFFALPSNPGVPSGRFTVEGLFDPSLGSVAIKGVRWVEQPPNYAMVDVVGRLSKDGRTITGKIVFTGCTEFHLTREGQAAKGKSQP